MYKNYFFTLVLLFGVFALGAQIPPNCDPPDAPPSEDCESACIYCDYINGYMGTTAGQAPSNVPNFCAGIQNDQWFGFIAGAASATFIATPVPGSCQQGDGIQIALYSACGGPFLDCNGGCGGCGDVPMDISVTNMVPGQNYFMLIDGYGGDQCDFSITVIPPAAVSPPPLGAPGNITGPAKVCPGGTATYCINTVPGAGGYIWTIPADASIDGQPGPGPIELVAPDGKCATITFGPSVGVKNICVTPANSCNTGVQKCRTVLLETIPEKVLPKDIVCFEDAPFYQLPWGDPIIETPGTNNYKTTITTAQGCDSVVSKMVTVKPQLIKNLPLQIICEGTCITVGGQQFCESGMESVTVTTAQGCDSTINFQIQVLDPIAEIIPGGIITCAQPTVTLNSEPVPGPSPIKIWKNGSGQVVGSGAFLTVNTAGTYILTVTQQQGGVSCTKADTIVVTANNTIPTVTATGGVIGCSSTSAMLTASTNAPPTPGWIWSGPGGYSSTQQNPTVTTPGTYTVQVTNSTNGCTNTTTATVTGNTTAPVLTTTGGTLTCTTTSVMISVTSNILPATYSWTGPGGFVSALSNPPVTVAGTYDVTVTNSSNGCTSTANAVVTLDNLAPNAGASVSGNIGCNNLIVTLNGTSTTANVSYLWSGPGGFTSPLQNPTTSVTGPYSVLVTGANGCTNTAPVDVNGSITAPDATATGGTLTCTNPQIQINGSSNTPNVSYSWNGPGGPYSLQNPFVNTPGTYTLIVTNPANDCTTTTDAIVGQDIATPTAGATGGIIDCTSGAVNIVGTGSGTGVWTGPGGLNTPTNPTSVTQQGIYTWTVTGANGCTNAADATVTLDANVPVSFADGGTINCTNSSVTINGGVPPPATFIWNGPGGFTSTNNMETVSIPGDYVLTATAPNGCKSTATAFVLLDIAAPGAASTDGQVTCTTPSTQLSATSPSSPVTYSWTGPGGFTSLDQNPIVMDAGTYTVVVTGDNGCTSSANSTVQADQNQPTAQAAGGILTCSAVAISLAGQSSIPGSTFEWSFNNAVFSINQNPVIDVAGVYTLIVTSPNGCTDMAAAIVDEDKINPDATATGGTLTCTDPTLVLDGNSTTVRATFHWTGPNSFDETISDPSASISGNYDLVVTGPNGCTTLVTAILGEDKTKPSFAGTGGTVSCAVPQINLDVVLNTPGSTVLWLGPGGFNSNLTNPPTTVDGDYMLIVTGPNGCTDEATIKVLSDKTQPTITATGGELTCTTLMIALDGSSTTIGTAFSWSGPGGFVSNVAGPLVSLDGIYTLVVTGPNGCTNEATATVTKNGAYPDASIQVANVIDCTNPSTLLDGSSTTTGATLSFDWTLAGVPVAGSEDVTVTVPGIYQLAVTNTDNGCVTTITQEVFQDIAPPQNVVADGGTLDCISGTLPLAGSTTSTGGTWAWTGPGNFSSNLQNPSATNAGIYELTVQLPNGCTATDTAEIFQNLQSPIVDIVSTALELTCKVPSIDLAGSTTTPNTASIWTGPAGFVPSLNPVVSITLPGTYNFTVTSTTNGCVTAKSITITEDKTTPNLTVTNATLTCSAPSAGISANSTTVGTIYFWTGPNGFTSNQQVATVSIGGTYTCTATGLNGCTTVKTSTVTENFAVPQGVTTTGATVTCTEPEPMISVTSGSTGVLYSWEGPFGFVAVGPTVQVFESGVFYVTATLATSGCETIDSCVVLLDIAPPGVTATVSDIITCTTPCVNVSANTQAIGATFSWTGPGITAGNKTQQSPSVCAAGTYKVTVTGTNGCTSSGQIAVLTDGSNPTVNISGGIITCTNPTIQVLATTDGPATWIWSTGPTTAGIDVSVGGNYSVTATAPNGCTGQASIQIDVDKAAPAVSIAPPIQFSCTVLSVPLTATATPAGVTFDWTTLDGNITSPTNGAGISVDQVGTYSVVVTNPANGCTTLVSELVTANPAVPSGFVLDEKDVRCHGETNGFASILSVTGGTPPYLFSLNGAPYSAGTNFTNLPAGSYSLAVEDALGCNYSTSFDIEEPPLIVVNLGPDTTLRLGDSLLLDLTNLVTPPGEYVMTWAGSFAGCDTCADFWIKPLNTQQLVLTVIDSNGCRAQDVRFIEVDKQRHIYVPTSFAPDTDNGNDRFYIFGGQDVAEIETFMVFDRWGEVVHQYFNFQPGDYDSGWDGTWRADKMNPAVYVWFAEIKFIDGVKKIYKGSVSLVR